jgi:hypothetical protein
MVRRAHAMPAEESDVSFAEFGVSIRPLPQMTKFQNRLTTRIQWHAGRGSNPRPSGSKTDPSASDDGYLRPVRRRQRQGAALGCTEYGSRLYPALALRGWSSGNPYPLWPKSVDMPK